MKLRYNITSDVSRIDVMHGPLSMTTESTDDIYEQQKAIGPQCLTFPPLSPLFARLIEYYRCHN